MGGGHSESALEKAHIEGVQRINQIERELGDLLGRYDGIPQDSTLNMKIPIRVNYYHYDIDHYF